jgi:hypothetical protein
MNKAAFDFLKKVKFVFGDINSSRFGLASACPSLWKRRAIYKNSIFVD